MVEKRNNIAKTDTSCKCFSPLCVSKCLVSCYYLEIIWRKEEKILQYCKLFCVFLHYVFLNVPFIFSHMEKRRKDIAILFFSTVCLFIFSDMEKRRKDIAILQRQMLVVSVCLFPTNRPFVNPQPFLFTLCFL